MSSQVRRQSIFFSDKLYCNYSNYISPKASASLSMGKTTRSQTINIVPIGNSKGIRIPKTLLQKYGFSDSLILEETEQGLLLRKTEDAKLSWEDTYRAMALEDEHWTDFDVVLLDGLEDDAFDTETL
jgi:antitoxin MazE